MPYAALEGPLFHGGARFVVRAPHLLAMGPHFLVWRTHLLFGARICLSATSHAVSCVLSHLQGSLSVRPHPRLTPVGCNLSPLRGSYDLQGSLLQGFLLALDSPLDCVDEIRTEICRRNNMVKGAYAQGAEYAVNAVKFAGHFA
jgi:hypothetical protein